MGLAARGPGFEFDRRAVVFDDELTSPVWPFPHPVSTASAAPSPSVTLCDIDRPFFDSFSMR